MTELLNVKGPLDTFYLGVQYVGCTLQCRAGVPVVYCFCPVFVSVHNIVTPSCNFIQSRLDFLIILSKLMILFLKIMVPFLRAGQIL